MSEEEKKATSGGYRSTSDAPIEPYVCVRVFGGKFAGAGAHVDRIRHKTAFETAKRVGKNGLRPEWDEVAVVLVSHPELAIVHIEVRDRGRGAVVGYVALPLRAVQEGRLRVLSLHDPHLQNTGARIIFARLLVSIQSDREAMPAHIDPLISLLSDPDMFPLQHANAYRARLEEAGLLDKDKLSEMRVGELQARVGMTRPHALAFHAVLHEGRPQTRSSISERSSLSPLHVSVGGREETSGSALGADAALASPLDGVLESGAAAGELIQSTATNVAEAVSSSVAGPLAAATNLASAAFHAVPGSSACDGWFGWQAAKSSASTQPK